MTHIRPGTPADA